MAIRQKYERLKKTIIKGGEAVQVEMTSREMKSTIAKAYGISIADVDKKYYLFRNRLRAYESFKRASGYEVETQSPLNVMYKQAKSMLKYGADYEPSKEFQAINQFSAVSITKGEQLAKATGSRYYKKHQQSVGELALSHFKKFIDAHTSAQDVVTAYQEGRINGVKLLETLSQMSKDVKASIKELRIKGGTFAGSSPASTDAEIPSAEDYLPKPQEEEEQALKEQE